MELIPVREVDSEGNSPPTHGRASDWGLTHCSSGGPAQRECALLRASGGPEQARSVRATRVSRLVCVKSAPAPEEVPGKSKHGSAGAAALPSAAGKLPSESEQGPARHRTGSVGAAARSSTPRRRFGAGASESQRRRPGPHFDRRSARCGAGPAGHWAGRTRKRPESVPERS